MNILGNTGQLPLHNTLHSYATLEAVKFLVKRNPSALRVVDDQGTPPRHNACEFSTTKVVQFLV